MPDMRCESFGFDGEPIDASSVRGMYCHECGAKRPEHKPLKSGREQVVEELAKIINKMRDQEAYYSEDIAKAALEFFEKRLIKKCEMPIYHSGLYGNAEVDGYNRALSDVGVALLGEVGR